MEDNNELLEAINKTKTQKIDVESSIVSHREKDDSFKVALCTDILDGGINIVDAVFTRKGIIQLRDGITRMLEIRK